MTNKEIEKQYNELRKKYRLPEFKDIDMELEVSDLEETNFLLRNIVKKIAERLDFYTAMLEEILQPDAGKLYAMHESRHFDDEEKKKMFEFYKKLMILNRQVVEISLQNEESLEATFINGFITEWKKTKSELLAYLKKMKDSWKAEADVKEDLGYLG